MVATLDALASKDLVKAGELAKLTEAGLRQRQRASRKHGVRAFAARGEAALDQPQRSRLVEIRAILETPEGVHSTMVERTASAVMVCELAEAWIRQEAEGGKSFPDIVLLRRISTYQECARRHLVALAGMQPKNSGRDVTELLSGEVKDKNQK